MRVTIEEALAKEYLKYYKYENFKNIKEIGSGAFGKVFRANWKDSEHTLAVKSFFSRESFTLKEIVREVITIFFVYNFVNEFILILNLFS